MTIGELAELYFEEGEAEHVRRELAFAQSILETGSFGHALDNNYGGIGACDSCNGEIAFPTPRDGVRGQIQLLQQLRRSRHRARPTSPTRRRRRSTGRDPAAAAAAYDTFFAKGRVPTWNLMGNGNWATDPEYAPKVLGLYFEMVDLRAPTPRADAGRRPGARVIAAHARRRAVDAMLARERSEALGEAAVVDGAEHEVAVDALDHVRGAAPTTRAPSGAATRRITCV